MSEIERLTKPQEYMLRWLGDRSAVGEDHPCVVIRKGVLRRLEEQGLVRFSIGARRYSLTGQGRALLQPTDEGR